MNFTDYLQTSAGQINKELDSFFKTWEKEVKKISPRLLPLVKAFIKACDGGKRLRGTLVKLGYELAKNHQHHLGGEKEILKVRAAYEILHSAILIHDDIIDQSPIRRGQPSLYKSIGISQAITLADLGFFLATKIISESNFEDKKKNKAINLFSKTMVDTAIGQMLDIQKGDPKLVAKLKTARYSISGPLKLGAILAGADNKLIRVLGEFGESLGIAFQIRDDILDGEALDYGGQEALKYVMRAKKYIPKITSDKDKRKLLEDMAEYLVQRSK